MPIRRAINYNRLLPKATIEKELGHERGYITNRVLFSDISRLLQTLLMLVQERRETSKNSEHLIVSGAPRKRLEGRYKSVSITNLRMM